MIRKKSSNSQNGFTLVELVVVTTIMVIIAVVSVNSLFAIMKGTVKAGVVKNLKQNGNYALIVLERAIRNSTGIDTCTLGMSSITVTNPDSSQTIYSFNETESKISSGSANLINPNYTVSDSSFDCTRTDDYAPQVIIKFTLEFGSLSTRAEEKVTVPFRTTVTLRNIQPL